MLDTGKQVTDQVLCDPDETFTSHIDYQYAQYRTATSEVKVQRVVDAVKQMLAARPTVLASGLCAVEDEVQNTSTVKGSAVSLGLCVAYADRHLML